MAFHYTIIMIHYCLFGIRAHGLVLFPVPCPVPCPLLCPVLSVLCPVLSCLVPCRVLSCYVLCPILCPVLYRAFPNTGVPVVILSTDCEVFLLILHKAA